MNDYNRGALPVPCLRLDYGFGDEWASVELGDGTGYIKLSEYDRLREMTGSTEMPRYDGMEYEKLVVAAEFMWMENSKLRDMCSELYRRYWDVEGDFFIDPEMGELEERLRKLGIETLEAWE